MLQSLVHLVIYLIVVGCILGLLLYLVSASPVPEPYKGWLRFLVLAVAIIIIIFVLLSLIDGSSVPKIKIGQMLWLASVAPMRGRSPGQSGESGEGY